MSTQVQVCEVFSSIQGESSHAGRPCFFIRLAGCNLACVYCDSLYARGAGRPRAVGELLEEFCRSGLDMVEVTGGEPLIQPGTPELLAGLQGHGLVLVETNGSQDISVIPPEVIAIMDLKCPSSGASAALDWNNLARLRPHDEVKFVIADRQDYQWAKQTMTEHRLAERCQAVLMSPLSPALAAAQLAAWMLEDRLAARLNLQWHKYIWPGVERGV